MYAKVRFVNGWQERLLYKIPESWQEKARIGAFITVPLQNRTESVLIEELIPTVEAYPYAIKEALAYDELVNDVRYQKYEQKLGAYYALDPITFYQRIMTFVHEKEMAPENYGTPDEKADTQAVTLTDEQKEAVAVIRPSITQSCYQPFVIHGVTGSGKTEVYVQLIEHCFTLGKTVIFMVPEVSLAVQFTQLFKKRFEDKQIFGFHSATSAKDKRTLLQNIRNEQPVLVIGVHLPIHLPIRNLGLIIIDEEHEIGYQEKKHPKINSKEAALLRAQCYNIPIVLGSATPSISTLHNVQSKNWRILRITKRFAGAFPQIKIIPLKGRQKINNFWVSKELETAIKQRLEKKEQTIIFINRRGHSFFVQCKACGFIPHCEICSVSLTYHENEKLNCHYCGYATPAPTKCACSSTQFLKKGIGTQQVVSILEKMFPTARVARADLDTTVDRKKWKKIVADMHEGNIDILIGTQTITKGYHFPHVTLVGILWADMHMSHPVYNATETTIQQLIQVAGRAGRQHPESEVIVQTMVPHDLFKYVNEETYNTYFDYELQLRRMLEYPPIVRFAEIELRHTNPQTIDADAQRCAQFLNTALAVKPHVRLLGPSQPPVHKIKNIHIRKLYLKSSNMADIIELYRELTRLNLESQCLFTPNPLTL
jgi:primosomal protein N' (replication factor Y)